MWLEDISLGRALCHELRADDNPALGELLESCGIARD
jgi:hypothetical protein